MISVGDVATTTSGAPAASVGFLPLASSLEPSIRSTAPSSRAARQSWLRSWGAPSRRPTGRQAMERRGTRRAHGRKPSPAGSRRTRALVLSTRERLLPGTGRQIGSPWISTSTAAFSVKTIRGGVFSTGTRSAFRSAPSMASACSRRASDIVEGPSDAICCIAACQPAALSAADGNVALVMVSPSM